MDQVTVEAARGLRAIKARLTPDAQNKLTALDAGSGRFTPRPQSKITRERFLKICNDLLKGDWHGFDALNREIPDAELDVVAVTQPEDLPVLRRVRRLFVASMNTDGGDSLYSDFTKILRTLDPSR